MGEWKKLWGYTISTKEIRPGIWKLQGGGFLVNARVKSPRTGKRLAITKQLPGASLRDAERFRLDAMQELKARALGTTPKRIRFGQYALSLFARKVAAGEIRSAKYRERWEDTLTIHIVPAIGDIFCSELRYADLNALREQWAVRIHADPSKRFEYRDSQNRVRIGKVRISPRTANGWLSILRVICVAMCAEHGLPIDPAKGLRDFDTNERPTYTDEQPNALSVEWAGRFLAAMLQKFPQHYAMTYLGFITGLRPSSLRPLRRAEDIDFDTAVMRVRRSHTMGDEIMDKTKTGRRQTIHLPPSAFDILREHYALIEVGKNEKMKKSPFVFPSRTGGMRTKSVLDKPFAAIAKQIGLPIKITPRAMRRTFQDLARGAGVHDVVTRSISGHATESMQSHYSTAQAEEQRGALAKVSSLVGRRAKVAEIVVVKEAL